MEKQNQKNRGIRMKRLFWCSIAIILTACTYTITMVHTEGQADDVVDETSTNSPDVSPEVVIPASTI